MAVTRRKFNSTTIDENGNLHANGIGGVSAPKPAQEISAETRQNVINSMTPSGQTEQNNATIGLTAEVKRTPAANTAVSRTPYTPSSRVLEYRSIADNQEDPDMKPTWESRYEPQIQSILNGILNRKSFDLTSDKNYQALYDQYKENYMAQGNRAMRDQLGAMAGLTGGYGSTAAQAAASQAYDNYMQNLNDRNMQLMDLAYGMYRDETADRYNQLGAVTGLDNTDYSRYRDDVNDYYTDRNYWANRYQQEYGNDWNEYQYGDQTDYQRQRDAQNDYDEAFKMALSLAQQGLNIPARYANMLEPETLQQLQGLAAQAVAEQQARGSGRSGSGGSDGSKFSKVSALKKKLMSNTPEKTIETTEWQYDPSDIADPYDVMNYNSEIDLVDVMNLARNSGATQEELDKIYNDMTKEQKTRYNAQFTAGKKRK